MIHTLSHIDGEQHETSAPLSPRKKKLHDALTKGIVQKKLHDVLNAESEQ